MCIQFVVKTNLSKKAPHPLNITVVEERYFVRYVALQLHSLMSSSHPWRTIAPMQSAGYSTDSEDCSHLPTTQSRCSISSLGTRGRTGTGSPGVWFAITRPSCRGKSNAPWWDSHLNLGSKAQSEPPHKTFVQQHSYMDPHTASHRVGSNNS